MHLAQNPGFLNSGLKRPDEAPGRLNPYGVGTTCEQPRSEVDGEGQISARNECSAAWDLTQEPEGSDHKEEQ
jgi:hypothetical protein